MGTVEGFADDYSFFISGLLELFHVTQDPHWVEVADRLMKKQIELFWDDRNGGFYSSSGTDPSVLLRMREGTYVVHLLMYICVYHMYISTYQ